MSKEKRVQRIAIVGAGIVGIQIARSLQLNGLSVTLFDQQAPGHGTSFGNAGFIATDEIFPLAHGRVLRSLPGMLLNPLSPLTLRWREMHRLLPWFLNYAAACSSKRSAKSIEALARLQGQASQSWKTVIQREQIADLIRENGAWKLFESDLGLEQTAAERAVQKDYGISCETFSRDQLQERIPEIGPSVRHGVFYRDGMSVINSLLVSTTLFEKFIADGGEFIGSVVTSIDQPTSDETTVCCGDTNYSFDALVVATGHLSGRLLQPLGYQVPIVAERGYHVEMSHQELSFDMPIGVHERGFYMTPMTTGLRLAGTTEFSSADHDEDPNWARADILKRHVNDILPGVTEEETGRWMGHRPTLYDFLPVIGRSPDRPRCFLAFGHHHLGLTLSGITADIMSELIVNDRELLDISPFALDRFQ